MADGKAAANDFQQTPCEGLSNNGRPAAARVVAKRKGAVHHVACSLGEYQEVTATL